MYNVTALSNSSGPLEFMQLANELSSGLAGHGLLVLFFLIILSIGIASTNHLGKSLLAAGMGSCLIGLLFVFAGLSEWYLPILFAVAMVVGIVMLQDKDYG